MSAKNTKPAPEAGNAARMSAKTLITQTSQNATPPPSAPSQPNKQ
jgi:hypothetical protein